jgi:hypothetical protein
MASTSTGKDAPAPMDPFGCFVAVRAFAPQDRGEQKRFAGGEHAWLGSCGAERALQRLRGMGIGIDPETTAALFDRVPRQTGDQTLEYGEIVALSGDFYETPEALFEEAPSPLPALWESNDLSDLRGIFDQERQWIEQRLAGSDESKAKDKPYPDAAIRLAWNAKSYLELALRNVDHFGWHNQLAYARHHGAALQLALSARGPDDLRLRRAIYTNAFADHFLTDGFAAGHIRVPRAEICDWAQENGIGEKAAGALSKLLHDQDGHADLDSLHGESEPHRHGPGGGTQAPGLAVTNALGDEWQTYCDGALFLNQSKDDPAVQQAIEAVAESVVELVLAWRRKATPDNVYEATRRVPFPDPAGPTLVQKFPADMPDADLDRLWKRLDWYMRARWLSGLEKRHLRALLHDLPDLMGRLRARVVADRSSELVQRLDPRYVEAFSRIA